MYCLFGCVHCCVCLPPTRSFMEPHVATGAASGMTIAGQRRCTGSLNQRFYTVQLSYHVIECIGRCFDQLRGEQVHDLDAAARQAAAAVTAAPPAAQTARIFAAAAQQAYMLLLLPLLQQMSPQQQQLAQQTAFAAASQQAPMLPQQQLSLGTLHSVPLPPHGAGLAPQQQQAQQPRMQAPAQQAGRQQLVLQCRRPSHRPTSRPAGCLPQSLRHCEVRWTCYGRASPHSCSPPRQRCRRMGWTWCGAASPRMEITCSSSCAAS